MRRFCAVDTTGYIFQSHVWPFIHAPPCSPQQLRTEGDELDVEQGHADPDGRMFPFALRIPGLKHVSDNLRSHVLQQMESWTPMLADLKTLETLLGKPQYRERLMDTCIPEAEQSSLKSFSASLKGLRWESIVLFADCVP